MSQSTLKRYDYTLGWICALYKEMAVAEEMLETSHPPLPAIVGDDNIYRFGSINGINIVIACLPDGKMGTVSAANVAKDMCRSFPSMRMGLLVGIGGGVPRQKLQDENREEGNNTEGRSRRESGDKFSDLGDDGDDGDEDGDLHIRLGDVVVSRPVGTSGGVVQYDFGKAIEQDRFEHTGSLSRPPNALMAAVSAIRALHERQSNRIAEIVSQMVAKRPKMRAKYAFSHRRSDTLFRADSYHAEGQKTCRFCKMTETVHRPQRRHPDPVVHYGLIASGNQVMKDGTRRDSISSQAGEVLCFEMEAAGLMDTFPCLVIRGICDYCDGHKNDEWQGYAAAVAAGYAKELIGLLQPSQVLTTPAIEATMGGMFSPLTYLGDANS
jgi:nucleoside phosphorylase